MQIAKRIAQGSAATLIAGSAILPLSGTANAAQIVATDVDVRGYCQSLGYADTELARYYDPYSWSCTTSWRGWRRWLSKTDFNDACRRVAGAGSWAAVLEWNNAFSWRCWR